MMKCPVATAASMRPSQLAFLTQDTSLTIQALHYKISGFVLAMRQRNVSTNTLVALQLSDPIETWAATVACWRVGAWPMPINPSFPAHFVKSLLEKTGCKCLFNAPVSDCFAPIEVVSYPFNQIGVVMWTSGSSGFPKPAVLSIGNLFWNAKGVLETFPFAESDRIGLELPLHHVGGFSAVFRAQMAGIPVVVMPKNCTMEWISFQAITHVSWVPTQLIRLLKQQVQVPSSLKQVLIGGDSLSDVWVKMACDWPIFYTYGMTEMGSQILTNAQVLPYREIKVDQLGDIWVKGETLFEGYLEVGEAIQTVHRSTDSEGWFRTGDTGESRDNGHITVIGRRSGMVISGGENVSFSAIEQVLLLHPEVKNVRVRSRPDEEWGQRLVAVIQMAPFDWETLKGWLKDRVPSFWIPKEAVPWPQSFAQQGPKLTQAQFDSLFESSHRH